VPLPSGALAQVADGQKIHAATTFDLSAGLGGESVAVAIKHDTDRSAYGFDVRIYDDPDAGRLRNRALELPDKEYAVRIRAVAGGITAEEFFVLQNNGSSYTDLFLHDKD